MTTCSDNMSADHQNPRHVAVIMDGNGRWATQRGYSRYRGHRAGWRSVREIVQAALDCKVHTLTLYAFSRENWSRPAPEIHYLFRLFHHALNYEMKMLQQSGISLKIIGSTDRLPQALCQKIREAELCARRNTSAKLHLNVALNYSGRWEIIDAVNALLQLASPPKQINETGLMQYMPLSEFAPVDLLIRTGGECRLSNFLLWHIAYTELFFSNTLWPDFSAIEFQQALAWFSTRKRRFGGLPNTLLSQTSYKPRSV